MKVVLLKDWEHEGETYAVKDFDFLDIDPEDVAQGLIDKGLAKKWDPDEDGDDDDGGGDDKKSASITVEDVEKALDKALNRMEKRRKNITIKEVDKKNYGFGDLSEYLGAVCKHYGGRGTDKRLKGLMGSIDKDAGSDEQRVIYDPAGGFLVPDDFSTSLLEIPPEADPIGSRTTKMRMAAPSIRIPVRADKDRSSSVSGGFNLYWVEETAAIPTSTQKYETIKLEAHELCGAVHVTNKMLRDSPISVVDLITRGFRDEYVVALLEARLFGTGAGQPLGVFNSPCLIDTGLADAPDAATTVALTEAIIAARARQWRYGSSVWFANHDALPALVKLHLPVKNAAGSENVGGAIALYQQSLREDAPDTLAGRPIIYTEYMPSMIDETTGEQFLLNADWGEYIDAMHQDIQTATSIHVRFLNNEETFRFTMSFDGMPWWKSALTPRRGATLSPFVSLSHS